MALLLVGELRDLVVSAADLKGACDLEVLGLEINIRLGIDLRCLDDLCLPDNGFQNVSCVIDFVKSKHIFSFLYKIMILFYRITVYRSLAQSSRGRPFGEKGQSKKLRPLQRRSFGSVLPLCLHG